MYQSKQSLLLKNTATLKKYLNDFLEIHSYIKCKGLKGRRVFLDKLPEVITKRKDARNRLECFLVGIDILKKSAHVQQRNYNGFKEYEFIGLSAEGKKVFIHLREEAIKKDKKLFLVSTYYQN